MSICIIGGSGFVGTHLIREIKEAHEITIIDKQNSESFPELVIKGDIRDQKFLNENLKDFDIVIRLTAEHRYDVSPLSLYYDVNVDGTQNILDAMDKNGIKHILFASSVAIYGLDKENPDEDFTPDPFNDYGKSKWRTEKALRAWYQKDPEAKTLSVIRPTVIFGEENGGNVYNLHKQIANKKFLMVGKGENKKSMAYVGNMVRFMEYLISNKNGCEIYNYADKPDLSTKKLIST